MSKITDFVFMGNRKLWLYRLSKRIANKDFTIISNNCTAGFIYHDLGLMFRTPTINLFFKTDQYITFVKDFSYYLSCPLIEDKKDSLPYPVGILKSKNKKKEDIYLYFNHYKTFQEAKTKWNERKKRINLDNICFILDFYDSVYDSKLLDLFYNLSVENKIALLHNSSLIRENSFCFQYLEDEIPNGKLFLFHGLSGKRYLDEWNYVQFLNAIKKGKSK